MKRLIFIFMACVFLATQGFSYQFNTNTKYGKLQQKCVKENDTKSCKTVLEGCMVKRIGNACEALYSIAGAFFVFSESEKTKYEAVDMMNTAYEIGCKELKHKNTCNIDKKFFEDILSQLTPDLHNEIDVIKKYIHGE